MRLLNTSSLILKNFPGLIPPYAILSHTWGDGEVTFSDMQDGSSCIEQLPGFDKLMGFCRQARQDGYEWVWIDTCCIDKSSSAELSEAINSMFEWYKTSTVCKVYLADVKATNSADMSLDTALNDLGNSRWFTRGWTLQELIAPANVEFYDANWIEIGTKRSLVSVIHAITGISRSVLLNADNIGYRSVGERLSWASSRKTTREEDMAYCLMGLFDVHFPLVYGEKAAAFRRLQEEILKKHNDFSILLWSAPPISHGVCLETFSGVFSESPRLFRAQERLYAHLREGDKQDQRWLPVQVYSPIALQAEAVDALQPSEPLLGSRKNSWKSQMLPKEGTIRYFLRLNPKHCKTMSDTSFQPPVVSNYGLGLTILAKPEPGGRTILAWTCCTHQTSNGAEYMICIVLKEVDGVFQRDRTVLRFLGAHEYVDFRPQNIFLSLQSPRPILAGPVGQSHPRFPWKMPKLLFSDLKPQNVLVVCNAEKKSGELWLDQLSSTEYELFLSWEKTVTLEITIKTESGTNAKFFIVLGGFHEQNPWCRVFLSEESALDLEQSLRANDPDFIPEHLADRASLGDMVRIAIKRSAFRLDIDIAIHESARQL